MLCISTAFSQQDPKETENELDKKYLPQGSIFSVESKKTKESTRSNDDVSYGIKFVPFEFLYSNFVLENEINLGNSNANVTLGIGYNFAKSYINNNLSVFSDASSGIYQSLSKEDAISNGVYEKGGLFLSCGIKFYKNELGGMYYNPYLSTDNQGTPFHDLYYYIRYSRFSYHYTLNPIINDRMLENSRDFKMSHNKFVYGFGGCVVTGDKIKLLHDFYVGLGMNIITYSKYKEDGSFYYYGSGTAPIPKYVLSGTRNSFDLTFDIGYSIGFGF